MEGSTGASVQSSTHGRPAALASSTRLAGAMRQPGRLPQARPRRRPQRRRLGAAEGGAPCTIEMRSVRIILPEGSHSRASSSKLQSGTQGARAGAWDSWLGSSAAQRCRTRRVVKQRRRAPATVAADKVQAAWPTCCRGAGQRACRLRVAIAARACLRVSSPQCSASSCGDPPLTEPLTVASLATLTPKPSVRTAEGRECGTPARRDGRAGSRCGAASPLVQLLPPRLLTTRLDAGCVGRRLALLGCAAAATAAAPAAAAAALVRRVVAIIFCFDCTSRQQCLSGWQSLVPFIERRSKHGLMRLPAGLQNMAAHGWRGSSSCKPALTPSSLGIALAASAGRCLAEGTAAAACAATECSAEPGRGASH